MAACSKEGARNGPDSWTVVIEREANVSDALMTAGHKIQRHDHKAVISGTTNTLAQKIKQNEISLIISEFPVKRWHVTKKDWHKHIGQLLNWARLCQCQHTPFIIVGTYGPKWEDPQIQEAIAARLLHTSHHRLCSLGLKMDATATKPPCSMERARGWLPR